MEKSTLRIISSAINLIAFWLENLREQGLLQSFQWCMSPR